MEENVQQPGGISIHRALTELKTIKARITKAINSFLPVGYRKGTKEDGLVFKQYDPAEFKKTTEKDFQAIQDLIIRRNALKSAIVQSNSVTKVTIGDKEMSVADAINFKAILDIKKDFITTFEAQLKHWKSEIEKENTRVDSKAYDLAMKSLEGEKDVNEQTVKDHMKTFQENNHLFLVDPLKAEEKIKELKEEIIKFETDVDAVLSESNAVTRINP